MRESGAQPDAFFFAHRAGRGRGNRRAGQGVWQTTHRQPSTHAYWSDDAPQSMLIDEVEAIWAAIDEGDDWAPLHAKVDCPAPHGRSPWASARPRRSRRTGIAVCAWIVPKPAFTLSFQLGAHYPPAVVPGGTDRGKTGAVTEQDPRFLRTGERRGAVARPAMAMWMRPSARHGGPGRPGRAPAGRPDRGPARLFQRGPPRMRTAGRTDLRARRARPLWKPAAKSMRW